MLMVVVVWSMVYACTDTWVPGAAWGFHRLGQVRGRVAESIRSESRYTQGNNVSPTQGNGMSLDRTQWWLNQPARYRRTLLSWVKEECRSEYQAKSPGVGDQLVPDQVPDVTPLRLQYRAEWALPLSFVAVGLPHRKASHFQPLQKVLQRSSWQLDYRPGIVGKQIPFQDIQLAPRYQTFFETNHAQRQANQTNTDYRGHLGCTLAHLCVLSEVQHTTVILEDDAVITSEFQTQFLKALQEVQSLDPSWDVLLLGFCCRYSDHGACKENDQEAISGGIVRVRYFFGGWAYVVHDRPAAMRILQAFQPISWHIDLTMAEQAQQGTLRVYGCVPTLVNHPGELRISSFDWDCVGKDVAYLSDTNF